VGGFLAVGLIVLGILASVTYVRTVNPLQDYTSLMVEGDYLRSQNARLEELEAELEDLLDFQQKMLRLAGIEPALRRDSDVGDNSYGLGMLDSADTGPKLLFWPVEGETILGFGPSHSGVDIGAAKRRTVLAAGAGRVLVSESDELWGYRLVIEHNDSLQTVYANSDLNLVEVGDGVEAGQVVALVGAGFEGNEPHLHFEVLKFGEPVSPREYFLDLFADQE
jgi:murein DD-endopeptidase MepM/ murein hydrolase activator NlpD